MKRLLRHPSLNAVAAAFMAAYGHLVFATCRVHIVTPIPPEVLAGPVIFALWHTSICSVPLLARPNKHPLLGLMSASRDGTFTRALARHFGIGAVVGSSSKGAVSGARALVVAARNGHSIFLTPDGPRGPAGVAKPGATEISRLTSLPLIPCAGWPAHGHSFASWDDFRLPYPFTTFYLAYGAPLTTFTTEALQSALHTLNPQAHSAAALATTPPKP